MNQHDAMLKTEQKLARDNKNSKPDRREGPRADKIFIKIKSCRDAEIVFFYSVKWSATGRMQQISMVISWIFPERSVCIAKEIYCLCERIKK